MELKRKIKIAIVLLALVLGGICARELNQDPQPKQPTALPAGIKQEIVVDNTRHSIEIKSPKADSITLGVRNATVIEKKDGTISVQVKDKGFTFEPGLSVVVSDKARIGLDADLIYYKRLDVVMGFALAPNAHSLAPVGYLAVGWTPNVGFLSNTDLIAGIDTDKHPLIGARVRF